MKQEQVPSSPPGGNHPLVLLLSASVRSRLDSSEFNRRLAHLKGYQDAYEMIYALASERRISNTEGITLAAAGGALSQGAKVHAVRLRDHFPVAAGSPPRELDRLRRLARECQGLVVGTPVYFGDRSSPVEAFLHSALPPGELPLADKVVGFISVGAKRNGGQETTNVLGLQDCLALGAHILGNGPPTSQYGGTAVAGDAGAILDDNFGLQTSFGTGRHVAQLASLAQAFPPDRQLTSRLLLLHTAAPDRRVSAWLGKAMPAACQVEEVVLSEQRLGRCLGCTPCPANSEDSDRFLCRQADDMRELRRKLHRAEGIILVGVLHQGQDLEAYQVFTERTRFIRRHHFELSHKPTGIIQFCQPHRDHLFFLRATNFFLRHNTVVVGPGFMGRVLEKELIPGPQALSAYLQYFRDQIHRYRYASNPWRQDAIYEPIGYQQ